MTDSITARIEIFYAVRDEPYVLDLLDRGRNRNCAAKARRLQERLAGVGLTCRRARCLYDWKESGVPLQIIPDRMRLSPPWHEFLRVRVPETGAWVDVDPTWDPALKGAGFPVAEWDGVNSTILAVKPTRFIGDEWAQAAISLSDNCPPERWRQLHNEIHPYPSEFNAWLEAQRSIIGTRHAAQN